MANIKIIQYHLFHKILFSNSLIIFKLREIIIYTTTLEWSTKTTSHMALAELLRQKMFGSMMANSKKEHSMVTEDRFIIMVAAFKKNTKMVRL